jgi:16S rRNA (cytidine1402-2'-O)-methyltransferase
MAQAPGRLYVIGTPIGNLSDLSPRAASVLASVDIVAAEDTRVTRRLLAAAPVSVKLVSYREETERRLAHELVGALLEGKDVALASDAGTPCISDPGYRLVRAAAEAGVEVVAVPGPSAAIALLSISGLPTDRFAFEGFPPSRSAARRAVFEGMRGCGRTVVFYESPRRVVAFLDDLADVLDDPPVALGRELTKVHEEVLRGSAREVAGRLRVRGARGEFVVAVYVPETPVAAPCGDALDAEVRALLAEGLHVREIAQRLRRRGVARRAVYEAARRLRSQQGGGRR